ncbi:MAG: hypothetical protein M5U09_09350 [Gammaproteobacteria bacterium]|nr:hypothetical protein [Gammaproteobacteria bacterium]
MPASAPAPQSASDAAPEARSNELKEELSALGYLDGRERDESAAAAAPAGAEVTARTDFSETAFWQPHLVTGARRHGGDRVPRPGVADLLEALGGGGHPRPRLRLPRAGRSGPPRT